MKPFLDSKGQREEAAKLLDVDKPVEVYRNLQKNCLAVRQGGIVKYHTNYVFLRDVKFTVSQAGRNRVLREKRKNVHAFIRGTLAIPKTLPKEIENQFTPVTYNPYKHHAFIRTDTEYSVRTTEWVDMMIDDYIDEPVIAWGAR